MKTYDDLQFKPIDWLGPNCNGIFARMFFDNGYGISVVRHEHAYCDNYTYEVAVIKGNPDKWRITYDTDITDDVLSYQTPSDITNVMKQIQELK